MTPEERTLRARLAAHSLHAQGGTNTAPARAAFRTSFEDQVDPDRILDPVERSKRAEHAYRAHMTRMAFKSARARTLRVAATTPDIHDEPDQVS